VLAGPSCEAHRFPRAWAWKARCRARDGYARGGAAEAGGLDETHAFREGNGEASIESVASAGGFHDFAGIDGGHMRPDLGVFHEDSLRAQGDDGVRHAAGKERIGAFSASATVETGTPVSAAASDSLGVM